MNYAITYEQLEDELIKDKVTRWHFNNVKNKANENRLELSDDDFKRLFKIDVKDKDINWIMLKMSAYKLNLVDALVSYITY